MFHKLFPRFAIHAGILLGGCFVNWDDQLSLANHNPVREHADLHGPSMPMAAAIPRLSPALCRPDPAARAADRGRDLPSPPRLGSGTCRCSRPGAAASPAPGCKMRLFGLPAGLRPASPCSDPASSASASESRAAAVPDVRSSWLSPAVTLPHFWSSLSSGCLTIRGGCECSPVPPRGRYRLSCGLVMTVPGAVGRRDRPV